MSVKRRWFLERSSRVVVSGILVASAPILVLAAFVFLENSRVMKEYTIEDHKELTRLIAAQIGRKLESGIPAGNLFAARPLLVTAVRERHAREMSRHPASFVEHTYSIRQAALFTLEGTLLANHPRDPSMVGSGKMAGLP